MDDFEETLRYNFEHALNNFDFRRVWKVMDLLEWTWASTAGVPSQDKMVEEVRHLFEGALSDFMPFSERRMRANGGFCVVLYKHGHVEITFELEESQWGDFNCTET